MDHEFLGGEPYVLDTPSGSGKTTFFRCLCGLERPEEGGVSGIDTFSVQFQEDRLCEDYSVVKNLEMVLGDAAQAREILVQLLPEEALEQPCRELSGGMKRRVSLVRAMEPVRSASCWMSLLPDWMKKTAKRPKTISGGRREAGS